MYILSTQLCFIMYQKLESYGSIQTAHCVPCHRPHNYDVLKVGKEFKSLGILAVWEVSIISLIRPTPGFLPPKKVEREPLLKMIPLGSHQRRP